MGAGDPRPIHGWAVHGRAGRPLRRREWPGELRTGPPVGPPLYGSQAGFRVLVRAQQRARRFAEPEPRATALTGAREAFDRVWLASLASCTAAIVTVAGEEKERKKKKKRKREGRKERPSAAAGTRPIVDSRASVGRSRGGHKPPANPPVSPSLDEPGEK